jgi:hypothetical protein
MSESFSIPPNAVRVWRGYRDSKVAQDDFFAKLGTVFVPATVKMQIAVGLQSYIPAVPCGLPNKPDVVPDETAVLFWDSQDAYTDGFKTLAVRTYTLTHKPVYRSPSGADFPILFTGQLSTEKPVYLIDKPMDWMHAPVRHLVGARPGTKTPDQFRATVANALGTIQKSGIGAAIACTGDDYLVYWEVGSVRGGTDALEALLGWSKKVEMIPTTIDAGLWNVWPGMTINPGDGFNMQFERRWE